MLLSGIDKGLKEYRRTAGALLVDVREPEEYAAGHIPEAINVPLSAIRRVAFPKDAPVFLYCLRGTRSLRAAGILRRMGYAHVKSIGGITGYRGESEKGERE